MQEEGRWRGVVVVVVVWRGKWGSRGKKGEVAKGMIGSSKEGKKRWWRR